MDHLKSNPNPQKWWDCIKQLAGYPKKRAISSMILDDEILTGDVFVNKINDFFTSITNEIIPLQPESIKNQLNLTNATSTLNLLLMKKVCLINCLIFVFRNR